MSDKVDDLRWIAETREAAGVARELAADSWSPKPMREVILKTAQVIYAHA